MSTLVSILIKLIGLLMARNRVQEEVVNQANSCTISEAGLEASIACESHRSIGTGAGTISKSLRGISMHGTAKRATTHVRQYTLGLRRTRKFRSANHAVSCVLQFSPVRIERDEQRHRDSRVRQRNLQHRGAPTAFLVLQ